MQKAFQQITARLPQEAFEAAANFMFEHGALGVQEENDVLIGYFSAEIDGEALLIDFSNFLHDLRDILELDFEIDITLDELEDQDWNAEWKKSWKPIRITDNILIKPSWYETPPDAPDLVIEIDPKMAFGSGNHGTTSTILQLMEQLLKPGLCVLDMGTGTGILAIAAAKLGAEHVIAFDNDPIATETAQENAAINSVENLISFFTGTISEAPQEQFDIITANVNSRVLSTSMHEIIQHCQTGGHILLSGILRTQEEEMRAVCKRHHLNITAVLYQDEWLSFETRL